MVKLPLEVIEKCQNIKLIFFDIDGTLLNTHGHWSDTLAAQLLRLNKQGIKLAIASGRPSFAAQFIFDALPIVDAGLFCTGAQLYDPRVNTSLELHCLLVERVQLLYQRAQTLNIYTEFYTQTAYFVPEFTDITAVHAKHLRVKPSIVSPHELLATTPKLTKLLLGNNETIAPGKLDLLASQFPDMEFAFANFLACPGWRFASVISRDASKHTAFASLLNYHNVNASEVAAFGDSHSDETFIELAGLGVAMGNGSEALKQKADYITESVDNHGVEEVIRYMGMTTESPTNSVDL